MNNIHRPVLLAEAVTALIDAPLLQDQVHKIVMIDGTFGRGGHSQLLLSKLDSNARLIAFDKDLDAIAVAKKIIDPRFSIIHSSFAQMNQYAEPESIDGILLDLGISSPQVDEAHRGFSFRRDGPLDMRMNTDQGITAAEWLEQAPQEEITKVIKAYGEERFASQIAKAIVAKREEGLSPKTTLQLANLVASVVRTREPGQDPATRTFQALRIFINRELEDLEQGLKAALSLLKPGGRLAVISFHSLEDRIVKQFLQAHAKVEVPRGLPVREKDLPQSALEIIGRVRPSKEELEENPRARSAIMRVAEKRMGALA
ncbi:16S rRNA (cytosine(1402)-N(4))-methyltransferase RsmH [Polynucleobacter paneuropaeus]|jgi:16S rRNA (cytosine1402-N4)-methyltransferase|uniref:16S rRNA (cytosine(1402)-N(4))-methyltransferase RsmH n=1 Tax=Polynucleobacter paneuropaeus TaxID=2527775 RepID=UPI001BFE7F5B|nr:16S rRNA (cytosine(1402)-N(4))-methyltransferase RsmH [Polynucleobacter paneuropaeus]MBT8530750.1 16S rRNA (cytosine(1402)-N(4))-methyltransferase RsmH [Polynucleobacter paneuropaeus]MBT8537315.1 16S rRNA (cytosine(1402)-N(4))-methyltransferase RsmH [Polynucleobacter paneuropaeus]MBT8545432.1 16S rRNA (cytosine(1402)-N(4))-methyltransferase RsmH [Polynucleobacter paneuropaeus]MBT8556602.1 16S rRNA (cytosine(1402)-N(4))-methyltransferase RsmH [Polynucleobacter paneuropaeus]MBT8563405.1 16S r